MKFIEQIKRVVLLLFLLCLINIDLAGQNFDVSNAITGDNQILLKDLKAVEGGFIAYGIYLGTLNTPDGNSASGVSDLFLAKYDNDFKLIWLKEIEGSGLTVANEFVVVDNDIIILGQFSGSCVFDGSGETLNTIGDDNDIFIAKYKTNGDFTWAKKVAYNEAKQFGITMDIDKNDDLIIGGYYTDSITFEGEKFISPYGMYYAKIDTSGSFLWAKNIITDKRQSKVQSISAFDDGYYLNGNFQGTATFDVKEISDGGTFTDVFIYKSDFDGNGLWIRQTYGVNSVKTGTITDDNYGNIYYAGFYFGSQLEVDANDSEKSPTVLVNNGSQDIFILKYNKDGNIVWAQDYGTTGAEWAKDLKQQNGFLYITGYFSDTLILGSDTLASGLTGDYDPFLGMIDNDGNTMKGVKLNDANDGNDSGLEISSDSENNAYWGGYFKSSSLTIGDSIFHNTTGKEHVFITKYKPPYVATFTKKKNITCNMGSDGELIVTPFFGVPPFNYTWSHNGTLNDSTATGLSAGTYKVTVTDALDSTDVTQYTLTEPDAFKFTGSVVTQITDCWGDADGAISLSVSGGTAPYNYSWNTTDGSGINIILKNQSGLTAGNYSVIIQDTKACSADTSFIVTQPTRIKFDGSTVTHIHNIPAPQQGAINLAVAGGTGVYTSYNWSGPSFTASTEDISGLTNGGSYAVSVTDNNVCTRDTSFTVIDSTQLFIYFDENNITHVSCNGGSDGQATITTVESTGTLTYTWSHNAGLNSPMAMGLSANTYTVTVTDSDAPLNPKTESVTITQPSLLATSVTVSPELSCNGDNSGWVDLAVSGGTTPYAYNWSNGVTTQDITAAIAGTYNVTITDAKGCTTNETETILQPTAITIDLTKTASIYCYGENTAELTASVSGGTAGYSYAWNDPASQTTSVASNLPAKIFTVTVTDANSCQKTASYNVSQPSQITAIGTTYDVNCNAGNDGQIQLSISGGTGTKSYFWTTSDGAGIIQGNQNQYTLEAGTYDVAISDANACEIQKNYTLAEPAELQITNELKTDVTTCVGGNNGTITITATGGTGTLTYNLLTSTTSGGTFTNATATDGDSDGSYTGLGAGFYKVEITDANGCGPIISTEVEVTEPVAITISSAAAATAVSCNGSTDGTVSATGTGGTGSLTYNLLTSTTSGGTFTNATATDGDSDGSYTGLGAGFYKVEITDANGCGPIISAEVEVTEPAAITISSAAATAVSCNGSTDGTVSVTGTGGTGSLTYNLLTSTTSGGTFTNATATDGDSDGSYTGLGAGFYKVEITDANGCGPIISAEVEVTEPAAITISSAAATAVSCNGSTDGTVSVTGTGGTGTLTYNLLTSTTSSGTFTNATATDGDSDGSYTGLGAGFYKVEITDANGCGPIISAEVEVTEPAAITISSAAATAVSCNGSTDGTVGVTGTGGTGSLTYNLLTSTTSGGTFTNATATDGDSDGSYTGLGAGFYKVEITDANGCGPIISTEVEVTEPVAITISSAAAATAVSCNGSTDGTVSVTGTGGTGSLTYNLLTSTTSGGTFTNATATDGDSGGSYTGLGAGFYKVEITDANGCGPIISTEVEVTEPAAITISSAAATAVSCNGSTDGTVSVTGTGGTGTLTYNLLTSTTSGGTYTDATATDGDSDGSYTGLVAGFYKVEITDANGCGPVTSNLIEITEPDTISIELTSVEDVSCNGLTDGLIDLTVTGGTVASTYSYLWSTDDGSGEILDSEDQSTISAGTYKVTVTDDNLCEADTSITIIEPLIITILSVDTTNASTCSSSDGSITVAASGGTGTLNYEVSSTVGTNDGNGVFSDLPPDDYTVVITDDNNCEVDTIITVGCYTSIIDISKTDKIRFYPNPTSDKIYVEINFEYDNLRIEILSISGQMILNKNVEYIGKAKEEIDLSEYSVGVYFIRVYNNKYNFEGKILLQ